MCWTPTFTDSPVLSVGTPCSSPQGNPALSRGAVGDSTAGGVCIYLQHRVCVGVYVRVFSELAPAVLWPTGSSALDVTVLRINVSAD